MADTGADRGPAAISPLFKRLKALRFLVIGDLDRKGIRLYDALRSGIGCKPVQLFCIRR